HPPGTRNAPHLGRVGQRSLHQHVTRLAPLDDRLVIAPVGIRVAVRKPPAKLLHLSDHFVHLSIYLAFCFAQGGDDCARVWGEFGHSRSQKRKTWFSQVSISCLARRRSASCALRQCSGSHGENSQLIT